ncbi:MAG: hypothetical protein WAQ28_00920 [Bacteroidia bacterium]|jgi:mRNA-degrading endonuclease YafQ of YafQ-DinJ toxin-antitoxin module
MLKKTTIYILLGIFLFNTAGYFIAFKIAQHQVQKEIKAEIKQGLSIDQLIPIVIKKECLNQVDWRESGKEFYYQGNLYDIVKSSENADSITYYCISDTQEELLFEHLEDHIDDYISAQKVLKHRSSKKAVSPSIKLYFNTQISLDINTYSLQNIYPAVSLFYFTVYPEINSPPPELA